MNDSDGFHRDAANLRSYEKPRILTLAADSGFATALGKYSTTIKHARYGVQSLSIIGDLFRKLGCQSASDTPQASLPPTPPGNQGCDE